MHHIVENGVEKKVSFDTWQKHTQIRYEDDQNRTTRALSTTTNTARGSEASSRKATKFIPKSPKKPKKPPPPPSPSKGGKSILPSSNSANPPKDGGSTTSTTNATIVSSVSIHRPGGERNGSRRRSSTLKTLNIDPKHFVIGSSPKRDIIGGSHYSRALLVNAHPLTKGPGPDNLRYLSDVDHLFFKETRKFPPEIQNFNPREKRGIWNSAGRCVYYVGLTNYYLFKNFRSGFTYEVVDYLGRPVLTSQGSQVTFGLKGQVSVTLGNGRLLGTMEQECFSSIYNIKDDCGRSVFTIQAPCYAPAVPFVVWCFDEEFEICMDDGISEIGRISRGGWEDEFKGDLGIEFETSDDNRIKALLLGVYFLVEFQYFKSGGNGVAYLTVLLLFVGAIAFLLSNGFGFFPGINSPLIRAEWEEHALET